MPLPEPPTDWNQYDLADIWNMVDPEGSPINFDQVKAWERMQLLCHAMATTLRQAAAELADRPPADAGTDTEGGIAGEDATSFHDRVDRLSQALDDAAAAAEHNAGALHSLTMRLIDTREQVFQLRGAWQHWQAEQSQGAPVPTDWQAALNGRARRAMLACERDITRAAREIQPVPVLADDKRASNVVPLRPRQKRVL
jgi:hypothetical protein